jgi:F-type H+/Na+-transporting ATPase subunit alpha
LKQAQFSPLAVEEQVVSIFAGVRGYLDKIEVGAIGRFETSLLSELHSKAPDILESIRDKRELTADNEEKLKTFVEGFARTFV